VLGIPTGDSDIISYQLQWDQGAGTYADLVGFPVNSLATLFTVSNGVLGGKDYKFKVRARNIYGFGPYSAIATFKSSQEPAQITSDNIQTTNSGLSVQITWSKPYNNEDTITAYMVQIRKVDGETYQESAECDASTTAIINARTCTVLIKTLRAGPYELQFNNLIVARVKAKNAFGWGLYSQPSTAGALIRTEPTQVALPTYVPLSSTLSKVVTAWIALTSFTHSGGDTVDSYHLEWLDGATWKSIQGQTASLSTILTGQLTTVTAGSTYKFRV